MVLKKLNLTKKTRHVHQYDRPKAKIAQNKCEQPSSSDAVEPRNETVIILATSAGINVAETLGINGSEIHNWQHLKTSDSLNVDRCI